MDERRVDRRHFLLGAGAGAAGVVLVACGGSSAKLPPTETPPPSTGAATTAATQATTAPASATTAAAASTAAAAPAAAPPGPPSAGGTRGGSVTVLFQDEGNSYDPAQAYSDTAWDSVCNLTFSSLYSYGEDGAPAPHAAAALPEVSADGLVYTIPLRPGVRFSNGREVVAGDYVYALDRVLDPATESWAASYLYSIKGAKERFEGGAKSVEGLVAVDDATLEITLVQPDVTLLYALTQPFTAPVPREEVERLGDAFGTSSPVGNGPFVAVEHDAQGQRMTFRRNDDWFWSGLPYLDEVEYRWGIDRNVRIELLKRGDAQINAYGFDAQDLARLRRDGDEAQVYEHPLIAQRWVNLHPRVPAFRDPRVRKALNLAVDRAQVDRITGDGTAFGAPFPATLLGEARTFAPYGTDVDGARALLAEAGVDGLGFTLYTTSDFEARLGALLREQWKAIGVDAKLESASVDAVTELAQAGDADAWLSGYYFIYPTAIDIVSQYYLTDGGSNYTGYSSPEVDRLTAEATATVDAAARDGLLAQVEQVIGDDAVHVFLQTLTWIMGVDREAVANWQYNGVYGAYYDRIWRA